MYKTTPGGNPTVEQAVLALRRLNSALTVSNRVVGARLDIRDGDLAVLDSLHQDGPQTPTELARRTWTHIATMTGILTRLERAGWVERHRNENDGRSARIHATGVDRLGNTYARVNERLAGLLASWTPDQLDALTRFLSEASGVIVASSEEIDRESHDIDPGSPSDSTMTS
ncbi:MarR family winged helix-turn-helix transcriptional regulator [Microbacterium sp. SORGH_AS_0888]|uniref:MarR family winged helix-turn-helix transcriptional regulator n=1 Tax=Microbacterium sp. SORGH_AS_0888 TaxID=3041791 RepID=UPI002787B0D9|nr:MarR family transcriptional regulator [Microbacterium sp. SORGH_AS_0888]MDQ1128974.1 DNA-binding MarR family transcriptional regulator [Microbacterium sp. SORGH_AS_0888]